MATFDIPVVTGEANFDLLVTLQSRQFNLQFRYNDRASAWTMNVLDSEGTLLLAGLKIVVNWPINRQFSDERTPDGLFIANDFRGDLQRAPPTLEQLGSDIVLTYTEIFR